MHRRTVLQIATLGGCGSLTGCVGGDGASDQALGSDDTEQAGTGESDGKQNTVYHLPDSVGVGSVSLDSPYDLRATAETLSQATPETPATIRASVTNTGESDLDLAFGTTVPFSGYEGQHLKGGIRAFLVPETTEHIRFSHRRSGEPVLSPPAAPNNGCWDLHGVWWDRQTNQTVLPPGETLSQTYRLFAERKTTECFPKGTYRFVDRSLFDSADTWKIELRVQ